uniref:MMS19 nucleotide excision repair protein n=1 Tax=Arion vulgaris TaxID=1028688 RepID=A0A0B7AL83_9EUPU
MATSMKDGIGSYISGNTEDASKQIAAEINKSNGKFLELVENLGDHLTNSDTVTRGRATQLFGDVLQLLPVSFLTADQIELIASFLLSKLSDHHSVQPHALYSLAVLTRHCSSLPKGLPEQICRTVFREVQNQTMSHTDRRATYMIIQNLLGSAFKALEQMGGDFVIGFIQQMDSEKDPRNLIICFNCAQFICSNMNLGLFAEEMFEVLGCYFPIDFFPPANDPHGITKEELILALRKCFAASSEVSQFCVPLLLEKMTSDLQAARLDAFLTLIDCCPVYGRQGLLEFLGSITSSIKREVLMNLSPDLVKAAKDAIVAVYSAVDPPNDINDDLITSTLVDLYQDIGKYLETTDLKKCCLAYSLLQSVASACPTVLCIVVPLVLPTLINHCSKETQPSEQHAFLKELKGFLEVFLHHQSNEYVVQVYKIHATSLFTLYESLLNKENNDLQYEAMCALTLLTSSDLEPSLEKCGMFLDYLVKKSVTVYDHNLRNQLLSSLRTVVTKNPSLGAKAAESLMQIIKTTSSQLAVVALVNVVTGEESFIIVNKFLLTIISQDLTFDSVTHVINCVHALSELLTLLAADKSCMSLVVNETALPLLRIAVSVTLHWTEDTRDQCAAFMSCFRDIFKVIGCSLEQSGVTTLWNKLQKLFLEADIHSIGLPGDFKTMEPFKPGSPWQQTRLTAVLEGLLVAGDIQAMREKHEAVFEAVFLLAVECEDEYSHLSACRCLAAMLNKAPIGSSIHWLLEPIVERLRSVISSQGSLDKKIRAVTLWVWLTKALECRGHSTTGILSSHLISLLGEPELGAIVAQRVGLIVEEVDDIFTARLKGNITPLYKQRFFTLNLLSLLDGYHKAQSKEIKQNYLVALSQITSNLPLQVMKPHFSKLVPLLLLCLDQSGNSSHNQTLTTLCSAVINAPDVIVPSVDSLIGRLLELTKSDSAMKTRMAALKCLENLTCLPSYTVVPHQAQVVQHLASSLDDKKRLVRKQAVETRSAWILLEQVK